MNSQQTSAIQSDLQTIDFLQPQTPLMVLVTPSGDKDEKLFNFLLKDLKLQKSIGGCFVKIILQEALRMNLHGVTQGKLQDCRCLVPALSEEAKSVNNAYTIVSRAFEKERRSHGGSAFIKVYFHDSDGYWKPLYALRDRIDKTYDSEIKQKFRNAFLKLSRVDKVDVLSNLLSWVVKKDDSEQILDGLKRLDIDSLQKLNTLVGVSNLKNVLDIWNKNRDSSDEEFWQKTLAGNSLVLSQVFSFPVILFREKAYVGGKGLSNTGGKVVDFLYANKLTKNVALVEIKTPQTKLLSSLYRDDVYAPSSEVSGAIIQIANYRDSLLKKFDGLINPHGHEIEALNPSCLLIAGNIQQELTDYKQQKSFELFRTGLRDVQLISYDELFNKVKTLLDLLEGNISV